MLTLSGYTASQHPMALICSEEKADLAAHVAAPIGKQCGEIALSNKSV